MAGARPHMLETTITPAPSLHAVNEAQSVAGRAEYLTGSVSTLRQRYHVWSKLAERCAADPSLHPDTQLAYLETMLPDAQVAMVSVSRRGALIGAMPLISDRARMVHVPVRRLRAPGPTDSPDRFDILCAEDDAEPVARSIWRPLSARDDWDVIELVDLPAGGPGWRMVELARADGYGVGYRTSRRTPIVSLDPARSLAENLPATTAKFRANVRRRRRNLEKAGPVELVRRTTYDAGLLSRFLELEHAGWKGRNGTSIQSDPVETEFYRRLARAASETGSLVIYSLECAGEPIAMHFGLTSGGRYSVPKLTYDERRHEFAPGQLMVWAVLEDLLARGATEFDFLGDATPWKEEWTDQYRIHYRAHIFNRTIAGRAARMMRYSVAPAGKQIVKHLSRQMTLSSSRVRPLTEESPQE